MKKKQQQLNQVFEKKQKQLLQWFLKHYRP